MKQLLDFRLVYLGTPYSSWGERGPSGLHDAFVEASRLAARMLEAGVKVYSPIAHTHPVAIYGGLDAFDHAIWLPFDATMMELSEAMVIGRMTGWAESKGVRHEVEHFVAARKPIFDLDPQTLEINRVHRVGES